MNGPKSSQLSGQVGRRLLQWAVAQADVWFLLYRCVAYVRKAQGPLARSAAILEHLFPAEEEDELQYRMFMNCVNYTNDGNSPPVVNRRHMLRREGQGLALQALQHELMDGVAQPASPTGPLGHASSPMGQSGSPLGQPGSPMGQPPSPLTDHDNSSKVSQLSSSGLSWRAASSPPASPGAATHDPNWQATKPTIRERNAVMFNNDLMADIRFIVGTPGQTQTIPAHKYVLATGSSVFYAMFYGGLAECKPEIHVPDIEPSAFLILLKYLYCDDIQLEADIVLSTLYVAKKYIVPHLARACVLYLETNLTARNASLLLSQSHLFEEPELMQRCLEVLDAQAEMAVQSEGFVDIDFSTLQSVLSRESLNCKEITLFQAAVAWAHAECCRRELEPSAQNKRAMLGTAIYLLRFPAMRLEDFANVAAQQGILTPQETIDLFLHFTATNKPQLAYPIKPRTGLKAQVCHRFQSCAYRSNQWRYRGRCDSIQFSVDKRIFMVGFGLYGSSNGGVMYNVKIELKRLGHVLAENNTKFFSDGSSNTFPVYFENPIQIEPECFYTASAILEGSELSFFGQEGLSEVYMGTLTFQFQCSSESTNGTGVQGGQIPELIYYGPSVTGSPSVTKHENTED